MAAPVSGTDGKPLGVLQAINKKGGPFTADDRALIELLADQAGVAVQRNQYMMEAIRVASLEKEMDLARQVQQAMIPKNPPKIAGLDVAGLTKAASVTGGDVFDLWATRDGRMGIFLGDASGHGLAPTLVVSQVRTLVRTLAEIDTDPLLIFSRINARMSGDLENGRFVTAFLGFLSPDGQLEYCSAGHGPLVIRDSGHCPLRLLQPDLPPLGVIDEMPQDRSEVMKLEAGGSLIILSDGIFEARDTRDEMFGIEQVCDVLEQHRDLSARQAIDKIFHLVTTWQGREDPADDQTIVLAAPRAAAPVAATPVDEA
jgi:phosphoserine phosphatase